MRQVVNCSMNFFDLYWFVHCSIITGRRGYGKNCLLYGLGRGSSLLFLTLSLVRIFSICSVTLICPLHRQLHDRIRCLTSFEGRSCRHWETGWSARFSSIAQFQPFFDHRDFFVFWLKFSYRQVIGRCKKSLGAGKEVVIDASTINAIFSRLDQAILQSNCIYFICILLSVVALSESEPYGVRGGSLVVLFAPAPNSKDTPVKVLFSDPFFCIFRCYSG